MGESDQVGETTTSIADIQKHNEHSYIIYFNVKEKYIERIHKLVYIPGLMLKNREWFNNKLNNETTHLHSE